MGRVAAAMTRACARRPAAARRRRRGGRRHGEPATARAAPSARLRLTAHRRRRRGWRRRRYRCTRRRRRRSGPGRRSRRRPARRPGRAGCPAPGRCARRGSTRRRRPACRLRWRSTACRDTRRARWRPRAAPRRAGPSCAQALGPGRLLAPDGVPHPRLDHRGELELFGARCGPQGFAQRGLFVVERAAGRAASKMFEKGSVGVRCQRAVEVVDQGLAVVVRGHRCSCCARVTSRRRRARARWSRDRTVPIEHPMMSAISW